MNNRTTIVLNEVEPAVISLRHPLGVSLDLQIAFRDQQNAPVDPAPIWPQLALLPRSRGGIYAYPVEVTSSGGGTGQVKVPGSALTDRLGYGLELYLREANATPGDPPLPTRLAAQGVMRMQGSAYQRMGPLGMIDVPVVSGPPGPAGAPGAQGEPGTDGQRGSVWRTGSGAPETLPGDLPFDMYLDEATGDVWQFVETLGWVRQAP